MSSRSIYGVPSSLFSLLGFLFYWSEASSSAGLEFDSKKERAQALPFIYPLPAFYYLKLCLFHRHTKKKVSYFAWWSYMMTNLINWNDVQAYLKATNVTEATTRKLLYRTVVILIAFLGSVVRMFLRLVLSIPKLCFPVPPRLSPLMKKNEPG